MEAVTHLEKVITGEVSAVTHLEKVIAEETSAVTYTEKVIAGEAPPITHLEKVIAGIASPVTHLEQVWAGRTPEPTEHEYTGAVPVTITANGTPLLDFLISGNMSQTGTPTPDNPIMPEGCGDITANMLSVYKENYSINANGVETYNSVAMIYKANVIVSGSTVTLNFGGLLEGDIVRIHAYTGDIWKEQIAAITITQVPFAFTVAAEVDSIKISIRKTATDVALTDNQYKIPILSANTTTPVYLGEVETTRKIKKVVLTGEENWYVEGSDVFYTDPISEAVRYTPICSHFIGVSTLSGNNQVTISQSLRINIKTTAITHTATDFKAYIAQQYANGTPVTVWYVLAKPTTGIVNEPLRKIGDYADTLSMEQAGVQIPTNRGNTVIDVETELKPSEMYIKYNIKDKE